MKRHRRAGRDRAASRPEWRPAIHPEFPAVLLFRSGPRAALDQKAASRSWLPFVESLLSLRTGDTQLSEAVQRRGHSEEALQHGAEQESSAAGELVLIDVHFDAQAACETHALLRDEA